MQSYEVYADSGEKFGRNIFLKVTYIRESFCLITVFFFIDCKSWWSKPLEGNLILYAKCIMNKVINNNSEIRLKKRGWRWKNKREKGNWNPRGYISLIKINSLVIQTILLIPDKCFSFKNISNIKITRTVYILNTEAMCPD